MSDSCYAYLGEVVELLRERAEEAHRQVRELHEDDADPAAYAYKRGLLMGYCEVLITMMGQAEVFGISLQMLGLEGFEPERLLITRTQRGGHRTSR